MSSWSCLNPESGTKRKSLIAPLLVSSIFLAACSSDSNNSNDEVELDPADQVPDIADTASNPYDVLFVSETKAYIIRYGSPAIWIVDPSVSADDQENFKIGEISLHKYDTDFVPEMSAGVIHEGRLYVAMQVMDINFAPGDAYLAVIDTETDEEIDVNGDPQKGLPLTVKNPVDLDIVGSSLLVTGVGRYGSSFSGTETEYTGGIERINLADFSSTLLVDDGDSENHPYGQVSGVSVLSESEAFFTGYEAWQSIHVYKFNPSTGDVDATPITGDTPMDVQSMAVSPEGKLWLGIGSFSAPEVRILNPADNSVTETIALEKNPTQILFGTNVGMADCDTCAVLVGVASDYGSSDIAIANGEAPYSVDPGYAAQDLSDIVAATYGEHFYRLGRSSQHNITKFRFDNPMVEQWQFSTNP